jgi:hypothetical protein
LAKEAAMKTEQSKIYGIEFDKFSIEFALRLEESLEWTRGFTVPEADFVFAVGDIWLNAAGRRSLVVEELQSGNLIETLKGVEEGFRSPAGLVNVENTLKKGDWCSWMRAYWGRVADESFTSDDEVVYERLIPASIVEGRNGHIASYMYGAEPVVEIATRSAEYVHVWAPFDCQRMALAVQNVRQTMREVLLTELRSSRG